jgi:hypothetical protein
MVVRWKGAWAALAVLSLLCGACDDDACDAVAVQLRGCCNAGPPELKAGCVKEAEMLEEDGNTEACEVDLDEGTFARCGR